MTSTQIGFLRGVAYAVVMAIVSYLADPSNLTFLSAGAGALVAALAASLDHYLEEKGSGALFGFIRPR